MTKAEYKILKAKKRAALQAVKSKRCSPMTKESLKLPDTMSHSGYHDPFLSAMMLSFLMRHKKRRVTW